VAHLQLLGAKYYMALTPETQAQADADSELRQVATSGPWQVTYYTGNTPTTKQRTWKIYEIQGADVVAPLLNQPVVMKGVAKGGQTWLQASEKWYLDPTRRDVFYAASGPASWARVSPSETNPPRASLAPTQVSKVHVGDNSVSFDVNTTGVPVLVKVSYFPNWHASGAKGPWRVTPNLMVVIPTSHHVSLHYGYTPVDVLGILLSLLGLAGVVWLGRAAAVRFKQPEHFQRLAPRDWNVGAAGLTDPYARLESELAGAFPGPPGGAAPRDRPEGDLDTWLGFPGGLDLAHYHAAGHGGSNRWPDGAGITREPPPWADPEVIDPGPGGGQAPGGERLDGSEAGPPVGPAGGRAPARESPGSVDPEVIHPGPAGGQAPGGERLEGTPDPAN
jgi:hypothetical protein